MNDKEKQDILLYEGLSRIILQKLLQQKYELEDLIYKSKYTGYIEDSLQQLNYSIENLKKFVESED